MTEAAWAACADPASMLRFLGKQASDRKLRLFCVACCRRAWHLIRTQELKDGIETLERVADGQAADRERIRVRKVALAVAQQNMYSPHESVAWELWRASMKTIVGQQDPGESAAAAFGYLAGRGNTFFPAKQKEREEQAHLVRDLFGPLAFRPVALAGDWLTPDVRALAEGVYAERAWERLPILADALEEAGCTEAEVLAHLRGPGPHARGCFALDLAMGKE
jgi:hypothetical protein